MSVYMTPVDSLALSYPILIDKTVSYQNLVVMHTKAPTFMSPG